MKVPIERLIRIIGDQHVELILLREEIERLRQALEQAQQQDLGLEKSDDDAAD